MLEVSQEASTELKRVLDSEQAKDKKLVVTFQGVG